MSLIYMIYTKNCGCKEHAVKYVHDACVFCLIKTLDCVSSETLKMNNHLPQTAH